MSSWTTASAALERASPIELRVLAQLPSRLSVDQIVGEPRIPVREASARIRTVYGTSG